MIYCDYNASSPLKPAVKTAMAVAMDSIGNPASVHKSGRAARALLETAREQVAAMVAVRPAQVIFTSGGTEANHLAVHGWSGTVLTSAVEHDSMLAATPQAQRVPVQPDGQICLIQLEAMLRVAQPPILLSIMVVNNETGVIQPWQEIAALAKRYGALLHCDAVQAAGKIKLDFHEFGAAMLTLSAHKIGGAQGCGALIIAENQPLHPLLRGGGQEQRRRAGTENLVGIVGFGVAAALIAEEQARQAMLAIMRNGLEADLRHTAPRLLIAGGTAPRVANTSCLIMPSLPSATQLMVLDLAGFAVSSGAACSSGKVAASHVLAAMGYDGAAATSAIRVSFGWQNTPEDALMLAQALKKMYSSV